IFITLLCAGLGWFGLLVERAQRQKEAVEELEKLGFSVSYRPEEMDPLLRYEDYRAEHWPLLRSWLGDDLFDKGTTVSASDAAENDEALIKAAPVLRRLPHAFYLSLGMGNTPPSPIAISALADIPNLTGLSLWEGNDDHLKSLRVLPQITRLELQD